MYTFDGENKLIILSPGVTSFTAQDVYSRWKDWVSQGDNAKWSPAFRVVGGEPTGPTTNVPAYYFLINGWRIRPQEANHQLSVAFNLYTEEGTNPFVPTVGDFNVSIQNLTSDIPGLSGIANVIWDAKMVDHKVQGSFGKRFGKLLTVAKFLGLK